MTVFQSEVHTQFGPVDRKKEIQGGVVEKRVTVCRGSRRWRVANE